MRVVYTTSGRPTAAVVMDRRAIIDTKLYWLQLDSLQEAQYLTAVINSTVLREMLAPLMPKGLFGPRDVHKHIWRLPIPAYDDAQPLHRAIADAGSAAAQAVPEVWREAKAQRLAKRKSVGIQAARADIREWLAESAEGRRVEELVGRLLGGDR